jgi:hypothetical protein
MPIRNHIFPKNRSEIFFARGLDRNSRGPPVGQSSLRWRGIFSRRQCPGIENDGKRDAGADEGPRLSPDQVQNSLHAADLSEISKRLFTGSPKTWLGTLGVAHFWAMQLGRNRANADFTFGAAASDL